MASLRDKYCRLGAQVVIVWGDQGTGFTVGAMFSPY